MSAHVSAQLSSCNQQNGLQAREQAHGPKETSLGSTAGRLSQEIFEAAVTICTEEKMFSATIKQV